jgi:flagellar biosynthesis protein FlhF
MTPEVFRAPTVAAALALVKAALGSDAVLVETRTEPDGTVAVTARAPAPVPRRLDDPAIELLLGLPGDGKTTVAAKLALAARRDGRRVALVTTDVQRVAAAAELEAIGRALGVRVARAYGAPALESLLAEMTDVDRILVDTTGAGTAQAAMVAELGALATVAGARSRRTLVVAATASPVAVVAALEAFGPLAPTAAVVTKADITAPDAVASQISGHGVVVTAVSRGRRVVDPLVLVGRGGLARRLLAA